MVRSESLVYVGRGDTINFESNHRCDRQFNVVSRYGA